MRFVKCEIPEKQKKNKCIHLIAKEYASNQQKNKSNHVNDSQITESVSSHSINDQTFNNKEARIVDEKSTSLLYFFSVSSPLSVHLKTQFRLFSTLSFLPLLAMMKMMMCAMIASHELNNQIIAVLCVGRVMKWFAALVDLTCWKKNEKTKAEKIIASQFFFQVVSDFVIESSSHSNNFRVCVRFGNEIFVSVSIPLSINQGTVHFSLFLLLLFRSFIHCLLQYFHVWMNNTIEENLL